MEEEKRTVTTRKGRKKFKPAFDCITVEDVIFELFLGGSRITLTSFRKFSDVNVYLESPLVRIWFVHSHKPSEPLDTFVDVLTDRFGLEEQYAIEQVVSFINANPGLWEYRANRPDFENNPEWY